MKDDFEALTGFKPLRWQSRLYAEYLHRGELPAAVDIPTGLGKTAVMALWLIARANGAALPRRLVYVVDRRAVVDQATDFAEQLRNRLQRDDDTRLADLRRRIEERQSSRRLLPISTLRGQHIDNREWLEDPSAAAIIIGTVDMVGSRLLFEGYGVSRKMRPYHAGLLGADAMIVLDEAHLVPPFERLLDRIERDPDTALSAEAAEHRALVPRFRLLSLSATGRGRPGNVFRLQDSDLDGDEIARKRLEANKNLQLIPSELDEAQPEHLAALALDLTRNGTLPVRCLVFCDRREVALETAEFLEKQGNPNGAVVALLTGARRGLERQKAAEMLAELGFIAGNAGERSATAFLVATSAGEVGVDLDADHMVCDLVPWERTVQRLGRVNRRGGSGRQAQIRLIVPRGPVSQLQAVIQLLQEELPQTDKGADVSPGALRDLKERAMEDPLLAQKIEAATTASPMRPSLTRPLLDSWSMTSLVEHTGRPEVAPWLRGWVDDLPQTHIVWRKHLPIRPGEEPTNATQADARTFFEAAPPHASEALQTETFRVVDWLVERARAILAAKTTKPAEGVEPSDSLGPNEIAACVLGGGDRIALYSCNDLAGPHVNRPRLERTLSNELPGATLVVDARMGGLDAGGSLQGGHDAVAPTLDDGESWPGANGRIEPPMVPFRVRLLREPSRADASWSPRLRFVLEGTDDHVERWLQIDQWRHQGELEEDRSIAHRAQLLEAHQSWTEREARVMSEHLQLPPEYREALSVAARLHDEGKRAVRWQRAFRAPRNGAYAKAPGPVNLQLLAGYRHEFGSIPHAQRNERFLALAPELQELVLHLIAAHHGYARPIIATDSCDDAPPSLLEARAREVVLRFTKLQKRWGPWGLAYWEALLRAADQRASRQNDESAEENR